MKHTKEAISNIKKFGKQLEGFIEFAKELENIDSLDNHVRELVIKKDNLNKEIFEAEVKKEQAIANTEKVITELELKVSNQQALLDLKISDAEDKAKSIEQKAVEKLAAAEKQSHEMINLAASKVMSIDQQYAAIANQLKLAEDKLALVTKELERIKSL